MKLPAFNPSRIDSEKGELLYNKPNLLVGSRQADHLCHLRSTGPGDLGLPRFATRQKGRGCEREAGDDAQDMRRCAAGVVSTEGLGLGVLPEGAQRVG